MRYSAFGLVLDADIPLPTRSLCDSDVSPDVVCTLIPFGEQRRLRDCADQPWYESEWRDEATGAAGLTVFRSQSAFDICYADGIEFTVAVTADRVTARYPRDSDLGDVISYLTGPVMGFLLRLRGVVSLHASAIQVGDRAVALVGDARAGKSTTAAQFSRMGYRVLTEDIAPLVLDGTDISVRSGCAEVALRPDAVAMLFGSPEALPRFSDTWEKRRLDLAASGAFATGSLPLGAIYLLANREMPDAPRLEPISTSVAMMELLAHVYGNRLFHPQLRVRELDTVHQLVSTVPVKVATTGADGRLLEKFCTMILDDVRPS